MLKDDKFDLALREKLKDAEEKVPSGVWKAVSSRLDDIEGISAKAENRSGAWLWVGGSLAVAALALALVLTGTFANRQPQEQLAMVTEAPDAREAVVVPEERVRSISEPKPLLAEKPVVASQPAIEKEEESTAAILPDTPNEKSQTAEPKVTSIRDMDFVAMETEKVKKGRLGSYVSGAVSGNGRSNNGQTSYSSGTSGLASSDHILETGSSVFCVPFSIGAGVRYHFNDKLSLSAGLDYSLLTRSYSGVYLPEGASAPLQGDAYHYVHYLGIPVNVYYNFLSTSLLDFYGYAGGEVEFCLASKYRFNSSNTDYYLSETVSNPLFSVRLGVGVEFKVSKLVGIYLDPGAYYCFYSQQPKSLRTERPFNFNLNAGVRFNF